MKTPLLSVIIPVYNVDKYLQKCIDSLLSQIFDDFEVILVDDGSTDSCPEICDKIVSRDKRFKVIHKKNEGVAIARKVGFLQATGKFVHFLDSDDWIEPNAYSSCISEDADFDVIFFGFSRINENSQIIYWDIPNPNTNLNEILTKNAHLAFLLWNKIFRKEILDTVDFSQTDGLTFSEDSLISVSALCKCKNIKILEKALYNYFYRTNSVTRKMSDKNHLDEIKSTCMIEKVLLENNYPVDTPLMNRKKFNCKYHLIGIDFLKSYKEVLSNLRKWGAIFPGIEKKTDYSEKTKFERIYIKVASKKLYQLNVLLYELKKHFHNKDNHNIYLLESDNRKSAWEPSRDVSVIIVNYNTKDLIRDCINSVMENTRELNYEIIVSDNGSKDGSCEMIRSEFPDVVLIENNENLGFGTANNRGLKKANGKYIFYLNSDTILKNNAVKIFFDYFEKNGYSECLGVLGCNLTNREEEIVLSHGYFPNFNRILIDALKANYGLWKLLIQKIFGYALPDTSKQKIHYEKALGEVEYVNGADMFMRNDEFAKFDEKIFLYIEETDMQLHMKEQGKKRILIDGPEILHLEGQSSKNQKPHYFEELTSYSSVCNNVSRIYYCDKNVSHIKAFILKILLILLWTNPLIIKYNFKYIPNILKGRMK